MTSGAIGLVLPGREVVHGQTVAGLRVSWAFNTFVAMADLRRTYFRLERVHEGIRLLEEAYEGSVIVFGPEDPDTTQNLGKPPCGYVWC